MSSTMKYGSGKEIGAIMYNIKEQRCLEKSIHTLDIEQTYSLKLLELNHRVLRVNHRKLKDRVHRIKTNLTAEDIIDLRHQEASGRYKPKSTCVNIGSAIKIAAAARRLNLNSKKNYVTDSRRSVVSSAMVGRYRTHTVSGPCIDVKEEINKPRYHVDNARIKPTVTVIEPTMPRRNISEKLDGNTKCQTPFVSSDHEEKQNPNLQLLTVGPDLPKSPRRLPQNLNEEAPVSTHRLSNVSLDVDQEKQPRPQTTGVLTRTRDLSKRTPSRPQTHHVKSSHAQNHSPFSSHSIFDKDSKTPSRASSCQRLPLMVDDSIESNFGDSLHEERRLDLLRIETINSLLLAKKKELFLREVAHYLHDTKNAAYKKLSVDLTDGSSPPVEEENDEIENNSRRRVDFDTCLPGEIYKARLLNIWKGLNKCRYLRMPDDVLDLSGIMTLGKYQIQLNSLWNSYPQSPIN